MNGLRITLIIMLSGTLFIFNACQEDDMDPCVSLNCDDNDACTIDDCVDGLCTHTTMSCDDNDPSTIDNCSNGVCTHTPSSSGNCSPASFPFLSVGNQITYYYGLSFFTNEDTVTLTISDLLANGNFELTFEGKNEPVLNNTSYYYPCDDKIYAGTSPVSASNTWFVSTNLTVGQNWTRDANDGSTTVIEHSLLSKTDTLTLPAGTFNNVWKITYHQQGTFNTDTIYWRHDIGYLKYTGLLDYYVIDKNF